MIASATSKYFYGMAAVTKVFVGNTQISEDVADVATSICFTSNLECLREVRKSLARVPRSATPKLPRAFASP